MLRKYTLLRLQWSQNMLREGFLLCMTVILVVLTNIAVQPFVSALFFERAVMSKIEDFVLFIPHYSDSTDRFTYDKERREVLSEELIELPNVSAEGLMISALGRIEETAYPVFIYNESMVNNSELQLSSGKWFSNNGEVSVILGGEISKSYQTGDKISFEVGHFFQNNDFQNITIEANVSGILNRKSVAYQFDVSGKASYYTIEAIGFSIADGESVILIAGIDNMFSAINWGMTRLLFVDEDASKVTEKLNNEHSDLGSFVAPNSLKYFYWYDLVRENTFYLLLFLVVFIILLSNFAGYYMLTILQKRKQYGVLFLCGLTQAENRRYCLISGFVITSVGLLFGALTTKILPSDIINFREPLSFAISGLLISIVLMISLISSHNEFKKYSPIEMYREGE